jgi:hypothetical protein
MASEKLKTVNASAKRSQRTRTSIGGESNVSARDDCSSANDGSANRGRALVLPPDFDTNGNCFCE